MFFDGSEAVNEMTLAPRSKLDPLGTTKTT